MKIDMHCHVKEGSIDSKVGLDEYITKLKEHGFEGMLITDHDTYKGYRHWKYHMKGKVHDDFVVLKGIEYDLRRRTYYLYHAGGCQDAFVGVKRTAGKRPD